METEQKVISMALGLILVVVITSVDAFKDYSFNKNYVPKNEFAVSEQVVETEIKDVKKLLSANIVLPKAEKLEANIKILPDEPKQEEVKKVEEEPIVFDGLTKKQLIDKLNRNLNSSISGKGEIFAEVALELGLDPYLAVAIVLEETGCTWDCSYLAKYCNNVGGQKGGSTCGGEYASFPTLDEGIRAFMKNLHNNYVARGLTTAEEINTVYAENKNWHKNINSYINKIRAN